MGLEDELRATARRMQMRRALGSFNRETGVNVGEGDDPLAALLRGAGLDLGDGEIDGFYDAMIADIEEGR